MTNAARIAALDDEGTPLVDGPHGVDASVGGAGHHPGIGVDGAGPFTQAPREERVEARPAPVLDALVEPDVVQARVEAHDGAPHGGRPPLVGKTAEGPADARTRQDAQELGGGVGDSAHEVTVARGTDGRRAAIDGGAYDEG